MKGEAEAFAIEAKATAEAEQMAKKADAWKEYREAAVVDMVLDTMPKVSSTFHFMLFKQHWLLHTVDNLKLQKLAKLCNNQGNLKILNAKVT